MHNLCIRQTMRTRKVFIVLIVSNWWSSQARQSKYNIGGLVGSSSAERNRFLILTFEVSE
jgi:hypothetical protein